MPIHRDQNKPGVLLARYHIIETLGSGGMSIIVKAHDSKLDRMVALKSISPDLSKDLDYISRLALEAQAISKLNHPNICTIYDILEYQEDHFIVMEYIEGETLRSMIDRGGALPLDQALRIGIKTASALLAAHQAGIIHRDVKPDNIMIAQDGTIKLMDFGIAKLRGKPPLDGHSPDRSQRLTVKSAPQFSGLAGTEAYMSPEQIDGLPMDERADIFSLGIVLYEMVTGQQPFSGIDAIGVMKAILHQQPPSVNLNGKGIGKALDAVIQKALSKDAQNRQKGMAEVIADLQKIASMHQKTRRSRSKWHLGLALFFIFLILAIWLTQTVIRLPIEFRKNRSHSLRVSPIGVTADVEDFPSFFPDEDKILYTATAVGAQDRPRYIWSRELRSGDKQMLVAGAACPDISPDGTRLVCSRDSSLYIYTIAPHDSIQISPFGAHPRWSSQGTRIAFCRNPYHLAGEENAIYVYNLADRSVQQVSPQGTLKYHSPFWSADDRWIICIGGEGSAGEMWLLDPSKGTGRQLSHMNLWIKQPLLSSSGNFVYFLSNQNGAFDLWRSEIDLQKGRLLGAPQQMTVGLNIMTIGISRKSDRLIFSRNESKETIWCIPMHKGESTMRSATSIISNTQGSENLEISPDGQFMVLETAFASIKSLLIKSLQDQGERLIQLPKAAFAPAWSADSRWIYFDAGGGNLGDIWRIHIDSQNPERVIAGAMADWSPTCSPDSQRICFLSNRDGNLNLWLYHIQHAGLEQITATPGIKSRGFWSHDAQHLAFLENCPERYGCRIVTHHLITGKQEEQLFLPNRSININHKLAWKEDDSALYFLVHPNDPLFCLNLALKNVKPVLSFTDQRQLPSSNCVFAIYQENLYLVSTNYVSDLWIAESSL